MIIALYILTILLPVHGLIAVRVISERKRNKVILLNTWRYKNK